MKHFLIIREARSTKELDAFWEKVQEVAFTQRPQVYVLNGEIKKDWRSTNINQVAMAELARGESRHGSSPDPPGPRDAIQPFQPVYPDGPGGQGPTGDNHPGGEEKRRGPRSKGN